MRVILYSDALRSASYRSKEGLGNGSIFERDSFFSDRLHGVEEITTIKYPYVKRRDNLPEPKEKEKPISLWSIIKDNIGKDLSGVCLPVYFNEPLSSLQKCFEDLEYSNLVDRASEWGKQVRSSAVPFYASLIVCTLEHELIWSEGVVHGIQILALALKAYSSRPCCLSP